MLLWRTFSPSSGRQDTVVHATHQTPCMIVNRASKVVFRDAMLHFGEADFKGLCMVLCDLQNGGKAALRG